VFIELLSYEAELAGITVLLTEESYTSQASFLDRDVLPAYDPTQDAEQEGKRRFSGRRDGRWYRVKEHAPVHSDVNGSYNIGRKVVPTAFDGLGIAATAVCAQRGALSSATRERGLTQARWVKQPLTSEPKGSGGQ
jgi:putative transposase